MSLTSICQCCFNLPRQNPLVSYQRPCHSSPYTDSYTDRKIFGTQSSFWLLSYWPNLKATFFWSTKRKLFSKISRLKNETRTLIPTSHSLYLDQQYNNEGNYYSASDTTYFHWSLFSSSVAKLERNYHKNYAVGSVNLFLANNSLNVAI